MMKNRLHIQWPNNQIDVLKGVKTEARAWDIIFKRNVENIKGAVYTDSSGTSKRLLPKTMLSENIDKVSIERKAGEIL